MKVNNSFQLSDEEAVLYLDLNWFDLTKEAQNKIMGAATSAIGTASNNFSFPQMEVRLLIKKVGKE